MTYVCEVQDKDDFYKQIKEAGGKLVAVHFYSTWNGPCKMIAPKFEELAQQMRDEVICLKVNVDENEELSSEIKITVMPTFVFMKNAQQIAMFSGASEQNLKEFLENNK